MGTHATDPNAIPDVDRTRWRIDPSRSSVEFHVPNFWGLATVKGKFERYDGTLELDKTPAIELTIDAASLNTNHKKRDTHLRSGDFFDVATHPDFTFTAESVTPAGEGVRVTGSLTIRDRTRPASFDATVATADGEVTLDGELQVNRTDYGMTWNFAGIAPADSTIAVHAVFTRQPPE
jgi:polyisoprenoid-binding protein YceI